MVYLPLTYAAAGEIPKNGIPPSNKCSAAQQRLISAVCDPLLTNSAAEERPKSGIPPSNKPFQQQQQQPKKDQKVLYRPRANAAAEEKAAKYSVRKCFKLIENPTPYLEKNT